MSNSANTYDVAIAGAGPAGTSAAIHLATQGARVLLVEQKRFPRTKLCGEFISPECLAHFERLRVIDQMLSAGAAALSQTVFYSRKGRSVSVPSEWFGANGLALGLSRAEMDQKLLQRAKDAGVQVLEDTHASELILDRGSVRGLRSKCASEMRDHHALVTVDATGRTRALSRKLDGRRRPDQTSRYRLVAFKAHMKDAQVAEGACEIYFYPGGYGGLSSIEGGANNLCFITSAEDVRLCGSDPQAVIRERVFRNQRAAYTLANAHASTEWLSVSLEGFGRRKLVPADGLIAIGDASAFIDPFTGSGMLIALESGELAAQSIINQLERMRRSASFAQLAREYQVEYGKRFDSRLRVCSLLRRAAFVPALAEAAIVFLSASTRLRRKVARTTRSSHGLETPSTGTG